MASQRVEDWDQAFHARPFVFELEGRRFILTPLEAQLLLGELRRLPETRHRAAAQTAASVRSNLSRGSVTVLGEDERRTVLRAIEGVRARRRLPEGLVRLSQMLAVQPAC